MNANMEAIEQEILRLNALKHEKEDDMKPEEIIDFKFMTSYPNFKSSSYYSPAGKKIDSAIGCLLLCMERHVGEDEIGQFRISTVWLSMDHSYSRFLPMENEAIPIIFETMIFTESDEESPFEGYQERYSYLEQAEEGHAKAVQMVRNHLAGIKNDE